MIDMSGGRISAIYAYIGFDGSLTPRLEIRKGVSDSENQDYFWDFSTSAAQLGDLSIPQLGQMMKAAASREGSFRTEGGAQVAKITSNSNATVADFVKALQSMRGIVRAKYNALGL
jgi:hypothetical protein